MYYCNNGSSTLGYYDWPTSAGESWAQDQPTQDEDYGVLRAWDGKEQHTPLHRHYWFVVGEDELAYFICSMASKY